MDTSKLPNPPSGKHPCLPDLFCLRRKAKKTNKNSKLPSPSSVKNIYIQFFLLSLGRRARKTNQNSPPWTKLYRRFTFEELRIATDNFQLKIGEDSFCVVYKGSFNDSYKDVAVKWYKPDHPEQQQFFLREMEFISDLHHPNIVSLIGYCLDGLTSNKFIVYRYMPRGTLLDQLHRRNDSEPLLSWKKRLEICIGAARGLEFLHTGNPSIIHRDIRTSNILLDRNWVAKITDFGLSKLVPTSLSEADSPVNSRIAGTIGYIDPEYISYGHVTKKSDVYSFGVVLFEVLSAQKPPYIDMEEEQRGNLIQWCRRCVEDGRLDGIVDSRLKDEIAPECLKAYVDMAYKCTNKRRNERPTMDAVLKRLQLTLLLQECIEADIPFSPSWLRSIVLPPKRSEPLLEMQPLVEFNIQDSEVSESDYDVEDLLRD